MNERTHPSPLKDLTYIILDQHGRVRFAVQIREDKRPALDNWLKLASHNEKRPWMRQDLSEFNEKNKTSFALGSSWIKDLLQAEII